MSRDSTQPLRVLFLCTGNSARSQMAEAILNRKGRGRFHAESAGSAPAPTIHPLALDALRAAGIEWKGHSPRGLAGLDIEPWDLIITLCERARERCPSFQGQPILGHWSIEDPERVEGSEDTRRARFTDALTMISRRIDLLLSLPMEKLERRAHTARREAIGSTSP